MSFQTLSVPNVAQALAGAGSLGDAGDKTAYVQISALTIPPGGLFVANLYLPALKGHNTGIAGALPGETAATFYGNIDANGYLLFEGNFGANNAVQPTAACTISLTSPVVFTMGAQGTVGQVAQGMGVVQENSYDYVPAREIVQAPPPPTTGLPAFLAAIQAGTLPNGHITNLTVTAGGASYPVSGAYYADSPTSAALAALFQGTVVQLPAFTPSALAPLPPASYIVLPCGKRVLAAALSALAAGHNTPLTQLAYDFTLAVNTSDTEVNFIQSGGAPPCLPTNMAGLPVPGETYPSGMTYDAATGYLVNPSA